MVAGMAGESGMSTIDRINRARWSRDQKAQAFDRFKVEQEREREEKLAGLRHQLEAFEPMAGDPMADQIIATARDAIARLTA